VVLKGVNRSPDKEVKAEITVENAKGRLSSIADCYIIYDDDIGAKNSLGNPDKIRVKKSRVNLEGNRLECTYPKHSAVLLEFKTLKRGIKQ